MKVQLELKVLKSQLYQKCNRRAASSAIVDDGDAMLLMKIIETVKSSQQQNIELAATREKK
jgi:hypothetical protein